MSRLRLTVSAGRLRAEIPAAWPFRPAWVAETAFGGADDLAEAVANLAAEPGARRARSLEVGLSAPIVQLRHLEDLPPVSSRALGALVHHQAGRFFRRNGHPLVTDAVWLPSPGGWRLRRAQRRHVQAAAVESHWLDALVAGARAAGLHLSRVGALGADRRLRLLPSATRAAQAQAGRAAVRRLVLLVVAIWLLAGCVWLVRLRQAQAAIEAELAALAEPLDALAAARREAAAARAAVDAIEDSRATRGSVLGQLGRIAGALPDSAFLVSVSMDVGGNGLLSGLAVRAADVTAALERSGAVTAPRSHGVARERTGGSEWERFTIEFGGGR